MNAQVTIACVATHDFLTEIRRGKRRSKYDQKITIHRGDVCILHVPQVGSPPFVLKIPGGVQALQYHPGNFIMSAIYYGSHAERKNPDNTIMYQDKWFIIFTKSEGDAGDFARHGALRGGSRGNDDAAHGADCN